MATAQELDPLNQKRGAEQTTDLFSPNSVGGQMLAQAFAGFWTKMENKRIRDAQKMYDWYYNRREEIQKHIQRAMSKLFRNDTIRRMNLRAPNIVERVISKLALAYKTPAVRYLDGGVQAEVKESEGEAPPEIVSKQSPADEIYQEALEDSSIDRKAVEWHKLGKLFNTVLVEPRWIEDETKEAKGWIDFSIHTPAWCVAITDPQDYLRLRAFYYPTWATIAGQDQQVLVYWSEDEHYLIDRLGNKIAPPNNPGRVNPYRMLPAAVLRFRESTDFWGEGMWDLVDGNEEVAIQYSNLAYVAILQGHGIPVAINMNLPSNVIIGPDRPIEVKNAGGSSEGMAAPSFTFANPNAPLAEIQGLIDWMVKGLQALKGLSPQSFALEAKIASGASKMMDSVDVTETREGDLPTLTAFEKDLFVKMRAVWNYHASEKISEEAEFSISFAEPKVQKSIEEKTKERESGIKLGTMSRVDMIQEDNPGLSREEAEEKLQQIIAEERKFRDKYGLLEALQEETAEGEEGPPTGSGSGEGLPPGEAAPPPNEREGMRQPPPRGAKQSTTSRPVGR